MSLYPLEGRFHGRHLDDGDATLESLVLGSDVSVYQRVFQPRAAVTTFHDAGRFGYSRDVTDLFVDGGEGSTDYIIGLVILSGLVFVFFMIWAFYLLLWKCLGKARVGLFATGHPYPYRDRASLIGRLIFLFSAIIVLVFSVLVGIKGTNQVEDVTGSISNTMVRLEEIQAGIQSVLDKIESDAAIVFPLREQVIALLEEDACEVIPTLDEGNVFYFDEEGNPITVQDVLEIPDEVVAELEAVKNDVLDEITSVGNTITSVLNFTDDVQDSMKDVEDNAAKSNLVMLAYSIPAALFIFVLVVGWWRDDKYYPKLYCLVNWMLLPFFLLMLYVSCMACVGVIAASESTADVCSGGASSSPDGTIQFLLDEEIDFDDTLGSQIANFYIRQCKTSSIPVDFAWDIRVQLTEANEQINLILAQVQEPPADLPEGCDIDADTLLEAVENLQNYILGIVANIDETLEWISCPQVVPLVTSLLYDTTCDDAMGTIAGLGAYFFVINFFGMMMVTFRSAYYPITAYHLYQKLQQENNEKNEMEKARAQQGDDPKLQDPYYSHWEPNVDGPSIVMVPKQELETDNPEKAFSDEDDSLSSSDENPDAEGEEDDDGTEKEVEGSDEDDSEDDVEDEDDDEDDESSEEDEKQPFGDELDEEEEESVPQKGIQPAPEKKGFFFFRK